MPRIQHTRTEVARLVASRPGITPTAIADTLLYHGQRSNQYAYALIHSAERAGLIELRGRSDRRGAYRCYPAPAVERPDEARRQR